MLIVIGSLLIVRALELDLVINLMQEKVVD